jgi:large subunit ribosomal protein L4
VHGPVPRSYDYKFPRKKLMGALRSALAAKFADGKLIVVNAFDVKEPKTKIFRQALDKLKVNSTALLVEAAKNGNRNLELSSRNIDGVELVRSNSVHPYHLMRYEWVVFTQPVFEKMQASLKNSVPKRQRKSGSADEKSVKKAAPRRKASREKAAEVA